MSSCIRLRYSELVGNKEDLSNVRQYTLCHIIDSPTPLLINTTTLIISEGFLVSLRHCHCPHAD